MAGLPARERVHFGRSTIFDERTQHRVDRHRSCADLVTAVVGDRRSGVVANQTETERDGPEASSRVPKPRRLPDIIV